MTCASFVTCSVLVVVVVATATGGIPYVVAEIRQMTANAGVERACYLGNMTSHVAEWTSAEHHSDYISYLMVANNQVMFQANVMIVV
jgi:hypothetical protein